jgi:hypothetical protein
MTDVGVLVLQQASEPLERDSSQSHCLGLGLRMEEHVQQLERQLVGMATSNGPSAMAAEVPDESWSSKAETCCFGSVYRSSRCHP